MATNGSSGWGGLLGDEEGTEPQSPSTSSESPPSAKGRRRRPIPADQAPVVKTDDLVLPGATKPKGPSSLSLPVPGASSTGSAAPKTPTPSGNFGLDGLQEHLSGPTEAAHAAVEIDGGFSWQEYREVILSVVGGLALVVGAIWYTHRGVDEVVTVEGTTKPAVPAPTPPPPTPPKPEPTNNTVVQTAVAAEDKPAKTRTPMLSVVSEPKGAMVEINGVVYGKTPLIMPSPGLNSLTLVLRADNHKAWTRQVVPDKTGHFSVNAKLEPQGR